MKIKLSTGVFTILLLVGVFASTEYAPRVFAGSILTHDIGEIESANNTGTHWEFTQRLPLSAFTNGFVIRSALFKVSYTEATDTTVKLFVRVYDNAWSSLKTCDGLVVPTSLDSGDEQLVNVVLPEDCNVNVAGAENVDITLARVAGTGTISGWGSAFSTVSGAAIVGPDTSGVSGSITDWYFILYDTDYSSPLDVSTRVISFLPSAETVNPTLDFAETTATINATTTVYFNTVDDFDTYDQVCVELSNIESGYAFVPECHDLISTGQSVFYDEWVSAGYGKYNAIVYFYSTETLVKEKVKSYDFINMYTAVGATIGDFGGAGLDWGSTTGATTTPSGVVLEGCDLQTNVFLRGLCVLGNKIKETISYFFVPKPEIIKRQIESIQSNIIEKPPIGYITLLVKVMTNTATSTIPVISMQFKEDSPLGGGTYGFDFAGIMTEAGDILSTQALSGGGIVEVDESKGVWDIVMPVVNAFIFFMLFVAIWSDIANLAQGMSGSRKL